VSEFEIYSSDLLSSSKLFLEEAKADLPEGGKQRMLRAALTHAFFFSLKLN
jgi:hypothetical protein